VYQNGTAGQSAGANQNGVATMLVVSEKSLTAPQEIRARRMQSTQDAARLSVAGGQKEFATTLQELRQSPARTAGQGTPTGNTLAAMLQRMDTDQDGRISPLELRASAKRAYQVPEGAKPDRG
jgi:hypothetical protein